MKIAIIGLGYVGLPLAHAFSEKYSVVGFDINQTRIDELKSGYDRTLELNSSQLQEAFERDLYLTTSIDDIKDCTIFIITVPTPIDHYKKPNLTPLLKATETVGKLLKRNDIVIYESTVYPGCTEEDCVPILEKTSGLKFNHDFFCGYSPERINPGDKEHTVTKILKVTSGSTPEIGERINNLYASVITAGTHLAPTIKVAEAAKVIENAQRDVNISFVNELAVMFDKMGIDTQDVLAAAGTKWNFLKFKPGLVGGHCIGVDPYYLVHKAESIGYFPQVILSGRRINENMGIFVANKVIKLMIKKGLKIEGSKVLVLGITFKENCPDIRNSRVVDVVEELREFGCIVDISDPWANAKEVKEEYNFNLLDHQKLELDAYDAIILAVAHNEYKTIPLQNTNQVIFDIKGVLDKADGRL
ncbi:nucleotide sugar dehydrogenase [Sulfuricurvum kujiense DSM 16994]|uniref:Nucleotide sugar dehydrogenase n=1 Tax=Sulfuricurvum kujiense (strain ATCC BAA-921 / DSM 16994 / JCM 11577 / YK-1) TaxID=709032 RepID=E4TY94_SULKY|nr:nucleotide sugar dehydrogenase [Sulfuricurvum kujiense]ADR35039.1 nucleotide sugar dehydrogenase [Sulfuricurvum kujiense DSM 16994]